MGKIVLENKRQLPSNTYAFVEKYNPIGNIIIKAVKNSSVLSVEANETSLLQKSKKAFCIKQSRAIALAWNILTF